MTSPTAEEVERRAKEMWERYRPDFEWWEDLSSSNQDDYRAAARRELEQEAGHGSK